MSKDIKSLVKSILTGEIKIESLSKAEFDEVNTVIELMKTKIPAPTLKHTLSKAWAPNAQWSLEKAIKPGPTLNYSKINQKPDYKEIEANAPTINYGDKPTAKPTYTGAADRSKQVRAEIETQMNEPALDTIARKQKMKKDEGTNVEEKPSAADVNRMTAKSEAEPHDDPEHEKKEKEKAKKIKDEAEGILDLHKKDDEHSIEMRTIDGKQVPVKVYPKGKKPKDLSAKPTRSVDNIYGVNYGKKTGMPVKGTLKNT